ncbi:hypothetical protein ACLQ2N_27590 [Streptomyces sp. DT224]|uniref:hypothetical protein n=1 Tax=Streptomyces sp. DT224 TaxID=3393426 RepID=UPI003CE6CFFB
MQGTRRGTRPRPLGALLGSCSVLLAAACGTGGGEGEGARPPSPAAAASTKAPRATTEVRVPESGPCEEDSGTCRVVLTARPGTGHRALGSFRADGTREHWIYLDCLGKGTVTVEMTPEPTFDVPCGDEWPAVTESRNQFEAGVLDSAAYRLTVDAPDGVRWSLSVLAAPRKKA